MSYTVTAYPHGTFSWADFNSTDIETSKRFYKLLFGWTSEDMQTGGGMPDYTMFSLNGKEVAGGSPTYVLGMPSQWNSYIAVDDLDAVVGRVAALGGRVTMPSMDVLDAGKMAGVTDPTGATVFLWEAKNHVGAGIVNTAGAMCWNELYTPEVEKAKNFYGELLGWTFENPDGTYTHIKNKGRLNGGIMEMTPEMRSAFPPNWTVYFTVENLDASLSKVSELLGKVHMPLKEISIGKIAMIADPAGASCMLLQMNVPPDEWTE